MRRRVLTRATARGDARAWVARAGGRGRGGASVGEAMCGRLAYLLWSTARSRWCCRCGRFENVMLCQARRVKRQLASVNWHM